MPRRPGGPDPLPYAGTAIPVVHLDRDVAPGVAPARVATGVWLRVRRGAYVAMDDLDPDPYVRGRQVALARTQAVALQTTGRIVFSHDSAALLWGLPLFRLPERTHVLVQTARAGDAAADVARHHLDRPSGELVERRGLAVTGLEQTVVDCARALGARGGLVVADAALAAGARRDVLEEILAASRGGRGVRCAREVVAAADDGAESPGETLARWALLRAGLPAPVTQLPIETHLGVVWADLAWPELRLVAEYDGLQKYRGGTTAVVIAEKRRQEAIEEVGWRVVRLTAADVRDPVGLARRLLRRLPTSVVRPRRELAD